MYVISVDVGGTKIAVGLVDNTGKVTNIVRVPTPALAGGERVVEAIARLVAGQFDRAGGRVAGVGVGSCGAIDADRGVVVASTDSMKDWVGTDIVGGIRRLVPPLGTLPIRVQNDVTAHLEGEAWGGGARGATSALMFAVGTGVGGAVLLHGEIWRGMRQLAGDVAHIPVPLAGDLPCTCGGFGHLEAVAAGPAIYRHYLRLGGAGTVRDTRDVFTLAVAGDSVAVAAIELAAHGLAQAVAGSISVFDPEVVVIGGGLLDADRIWWDAFVSACRSQLRPVFASIRIEAAALGSSAAMIGAAHSIWKDLL